MAAADEKISALSTSAAFDGTELFALVDVSGAPYVTKKNTTTAMGTFVVEVQTFSGLSTTDKTIQGAINEVYASIVTESLWDRNAGSGFLYPQTAGDDLNMLDGTIFSIDPAMPVTKKSYQISQTVTGVAPGFENARIDLYGLYSGGERVVYSYAGASNSHNWTGQDYTYDNNTGTVSQHIYKTELNTVDGTGIILQEFFGLNDASPTPADYQYTQIGHIIKTNTEGSEDAAMALSVSEAGSMTEYMRLDGKNIKITTAKPVDLANNSIAVTQSVADNSTKVATTAYVQNELNANIPAAQEEILTISGDGQTAFTLAGTPNSDADFTLYLNGQLRTLTADYTRSGTSLTWGDPGGLTLKTTDELKARYNAVSSGIESPTELNYVQAYDDTLQAISVGATPQDVLFSTNVQLNGWTHTAGTANFTCNATGKYLVTYAVYFEKTAGAPSQMEAWVNFNGSQVSDTHASVSTITNNVIQEMGASSIISATVSQVLKIEIQAPNTFFQLNQHTLPEPTARITIVRIS